MTSPFASTPLGAIVAADYRAASVLDRFGLDFCCGGKRTLEEACKQRGMSLEAVETALLASPERSAEVVPDATWEPDELTRYIVRRHHAYVRAEAPSIAARLAKLTKVHGQRHPELVTIAAHFDQIASDLNLHMMKEEEILFPYIRALASSLEQDAAPPPNMFGTVMNPIRMMEAEHQNAGSELEIVRALTGNFTMPDDGCATYRACFEELAAFDRDLRVHIHLENNILFPRAVALESALKTTVRI